MQYYNVRQNNSDYNNNEKSTSYGMTIKSNKVWWTKLKLYPS